VGLLGALGNDPQLTGMGQNDPVGELLGQGGEPVVADRRLDDDLELAEFLEERLELIDRAAANPHASHDDKFTRDFLEDAENDNLLLEVRTDELHGDSPFVEAVGSKERLPTVYHVLKERPTSRCGPSLSGH